MERREDTSKTCNVWKDGAGDSRSKGAADGVAMGLPPLQGENIRRRSFQTFHVWLLSLAAPRQRDTFPDRRFLIFTPYFGIPSFSAKLTASKNACPAIVLSK